MAPLSSSRNWVYDIFLSYCGEDVRNTFIGPFVKELDRKLTTSFIVRSHSIAPEFVAAIQDSRIAVVVLSKSYASSSRCLNELLETVKCKEEFGLIVIPVFYGLDGRKQIGEFGRIFSKTCENTTKEKRNQWLKALTKVATYQSATWGNEATMIDAVVSDVLDIMGGKVVTELVNQLFEISGKGKSYRCKSIAFQLGTIIEDFQPTIKEIQCSSVELSEHRQVQFRMFLETLDKCKKHTNKVLKGSRWNMAGQLYHFKKLEDLNKRISSFVRGTLLTNIFADIHLLRANVEVRYNRIDKNVNRMTEMLGSMKLRGTESMGEALKMAEAAVEMDTDDDLGNLVVGLELGKRKVKERLFNREIFHYHGWTIQ